MNTDTQIINTYFGLLSNLEPSLKLKLIEWLLKSIDFDLKPGSDDIEKSFGAFTDSRSADEIITDIRKSRLFNREIESF